jgi:hypothetical protein
MPVGPAAERARGHKVFIMLLPYCHSFPPLKCDIMSICRKDPSMKQTPHPAKKGARFLLLFLAQGRSLSRYVTKIRQLAVNAKSHNETHVIANKAVSQLAWQERGK